MAEAHTQSEAEAPKDKFPVEIILSDGDPRNGYYTLRLTIPDMKTKKGIFDKVATVTNGQCKVQITEENLSVSAKVEKDGKTSAYAYEKTLPEKIKEKQSKFKLKDEQVIIILAKMENISMGKYEGYFRKRP